MKLKKAKMQNIKVRSSKPRPTVRTRKGKRTSLNSTRKKGK